VSDSPIALAAIAFGALLLIALCYANCQRRDECKAKGGEWYQPYKSSGVCLKPGTVMP
jgi:hypothetical protein